MSTKRGMFVKIVVDWGTMLRLVTSNDLGVFKPIPEPSVRLGTECSMFLLRYVLIVCLIV